MPARLIVSDPGVSISVAAFFDELQNENGLHDRGGAVRTAAQPGQDLQVFKVATARSPQARMRACARLTER